MRLTFFFLFPAGQVKLKPCWLVICMKLLFFCLLLSSSPCFIHPSGEHQAIFNYLIELRGLECNAVIQALEHKRRSIFFMQEKETNISEPCLSGRKGRRLSMQKRYQHIYNVYRCREQVSLICHRPDLSIFLHLQWVCYENEQVFC